MFTDAQYALLFDRLGHEAQVVDSGGTVVATLQGYFRIRGQIIDLGGPNYSEIPGQFDADEVTFDCRTVDVTGSWVRTHRIRLKGPGFAHREGASFDREFAIDGRRDDAHGITVFRLSR